jgi:hypothetical protein
MTKLMERMVAEVNKLPEPEQDAYALMVLAELNSEREWDERFAASESKLNRLAAKARDHFRDGRTEELNPEKL